MKIQPTSSTPATQPERAEGAARPQPQPDAARTTGRPAGDAIQLSSEARQVVSISPEQRDRAELVARLRREVDAGTYRPDAEAVARQLARKLQG